MQNTEKSVGGAYWSVFPYKEKEDKRFVKIAKKCRLRLDNIFFADYNMFEN